MKQRRKMFKPFLLGLVCLFITVGMLKWTKFDYDLTAAFVGPNKELETFLIDFQVENEVHDLLMARLSKLDEKTKAKFLSESKALGLELDSAPRDGDDQKVDLRDVGAMYLMSRDAQPASIGSQVARRFFAEFLLPNPNLQALSKDLFGFEKSAHEFLASRRHFADDPSKGDFAFRNVALASSPQRWIFFEKWKDTVSMYGDFLKHDATHWVVIRDMSVSVFTSLILIGILIVFYVRDFRFLSIVFVSFLAGLATMLIGLKLFFGQVFPVFFPLMTVGLVISISFLTFLSGIEGLRRKGNIRSLFLLVLVLVLLSGSLLFSNSKFVVQIGVAFLFYSLGSLAVSMWFSDEFKKLYFPKSANKGVGRVKYKRILIPLASILMILSFLWSYRGTPQIKAESSDVAFIPKSLIEMRQEILVGPQEGAIGVVLEKKGLVAILSSEDLLLFEKLSSIAVQPIQITEFYRRVVDSFTKSLNLFGVSLNPSLILPKEVSVDSSASPLNLLRFVCRGFGFTCLNQHPNWLGARVTLDQVNQIRNSGYSVFQIEEEGRLEEVVKETGEGLLFIALFVLFIVTGLAILFQANLFFSLISVSIVGLSSVIWVTFVERVTLPSTLGLLWSGIIMFFTISNYLKPSCQDEDQSKSEFVQASLIITSFCLVLTKHPFVFQFGMACLFVSLSSKLMAIALVTRARSSSRASIY